MNKYIQVMVKSNHKIIQNNQKEKDMNQFIKLIKKIYYLICHDTILINFERIYLH